MRRSGSMLALAIVLLAGLALPAPATGAAETGAAPEAPAPAEQGVPFRQDPVLPAGSLARVVAVTLGGVLLVWLAALALRRHYFGADSRAPAERRIRVLETQRLAPRASLMLVRVGDREILLGQSGDRLVVLHEGEAERGREARRDA